MSRDAKLLAKNLARAAIILEPNNTLYDARSYLLRYYISRVLIAKDNKPLGIITEKDIARFLYTEMPNRRLNEITINEIMSKSLVTVEEQTDLNVCAKTMLEKKISSIIVIDKNESLRGIFTKSDLIDMYAKYSHNKIKTEQYMTKKVITVAPDENLHMILLLMTDNEISRIPVTKDHRPVGIISGRDLLPVSILFGTGALGKYWTTEQELISRKHAQRVIPSGIKAVLLARDIMKYDPITITKESDLVEAAQVMSNNRISGLPVTSDDSAEASLVGIITKTDLVKAIADDTTA
jgi:CBS domain-containing protein